MNKEEIKVMIKDCVYSEDGITYMSDKQYNNYIDIIEQLQQENQELKKRLEENKHKGLYNTCLPYSTGYNKAIKEKENQQKEFIEYLESYLKLFDNKDIYEEGYYDCIEEILSKYKEIIEKWEKGE